MTETILNLLSCVTCGMRFVCSKLTVRKDEYKEAGIVAIHSTNASFHLKFANRD